MEYRVLVAHGARDETVHSVDNVKIITKAYTNLSFEEAKKYFQTGEPKSEYASTAVGECAPLSDRDYQKLFGERPPVGVGYVSTGKYVQGDIGGKKIYALRTNNATLQDISVWAASFNGKVILVACRG